MVGSILGTRVLRVEDPRFITVGGRYVDDLRIDGDVAFTGAAVAHYVRSAVAHGTITTIDTSEARAVPGVLAVFTAADLALEPVPSRFNPALARPLLASERVRYVGDPVAVIVATDAGAAADAADTVIVDYDVLDAYVDPLAALAGDTLLFDAAGSNVVFDSTTIGMPGLSDGDFFAGCDVVVTGHFVNQRMAPCPLEPRSAAAAWVDGRLYVWMSTQHAQGARDLIATVNGLDATAVRVVTPDVGGGFGAKITPYPEELLLGRLAKELGRPVAWMETRSESMTSLGHGRAQIHDVTIGGTRDGRVTHYQLDIVQNSGASAEVGAVLGTFMTRPMASGVYDIANIECRARSVVTNTPPIVAFRGAGRPEATAAIERAIDLFAAELGRDPAEIRRLNLIAPFNDPHVTAIGQTYDVGDYVGALDRVLAAAGYDELRAEQRRRRESGAGNLLGIGVSVYVEITNSIPGDETAAIEVAADGTAVVRTGTSPHGQGHETAWAMIAAEHTGLPIEAIRVVWGDTDVVPTGGGTLGSRSLQIGGAAVDAAAAELVDIALRVAADRLEADVADVVLDPTVGRFHVAGTPAVTLSWADVASASLEAGAPLAASTTLNWTVPTFPFGAHVAVVEVDADTGHVRLVRHIVCDDAGRIVNPLLVEGQLHGGIASGAAQALMEEVCFDDDGNPITSNLADYAMISAAELPSFELVSMETPTPVNRLGAKGVGESGTIGSTPAVQSAVVDALAHLGVRHLVATHEHRHPMRATAAPAEGAARHGLRGRGTQEYDTIMRLTGIELRRVAMPLRTPFRTSFGTQLDRDVLLIRAEGTVDGAPASGWGECVAMTEPRYSAEYVDGAEHVIAHFFAPLLFAHGDVTAADVGPLLSVFEGHPMAKAAVEMAVLDAELRASGVSFAEHLGAVTDRVPAGVSVGITDSTPALLEQVAGYLDDGYVRIKLKIEPGLDVDRVAAVRERFGDELLLQVDANAAYTLDDAEHLAQLDAFNLLLVEQPLAADDLRHHSLLAKRMRTPICLDESITSAKTAADAIALGACAIVNIKAGRVGGYLEAKRVHDMCQVHGVPVWCGGMLETGLGRAANVALAALPGFTLPGDTSASDRYWERDLTTPFVLDADGHVAVPSGPGLGVEPLPDVLAEVTTATRRLHP